MFGKKAKYIVAGLSLAMAVSPVVALADDTTPAATPSVKVVKTVTMNEGSTLTAEFKFKAEKTQLFAGTANATAATTESGFPELTEATTGSKTWSSSANSNDAAFTHLPTVEQFPHAGVYAWKVTEDTTGSTQATGANEELTYDNEKVYTLVAVVTNATKDAEGNDVPASVTWGFYNGTPTDVKDVQGVNKAGEADFTNKYVEKTNNGENKPLVVKKTVTGAQGDKTKQFNFTVILTAPANVPTGWTLGDVTVTPKTGSNATVTDGGSVVTAADGTQTRTVKFTAADSESVTFDNVVVGTTYTVAEDSYTTEGYTTSGTVSEAKTLSEKGAEEEVVNEKASSVVTGVIVNNAPFIVMIGVAAAGVVGYGAAKRKLEK